MAAINKRNRTELNETERNGTEQKTHTQTQTQRYTTSISWGAIVSSFPLSLARFLFLPLLNWLLLLLFLPLLMLILLLLLPFLPLLILPPASAFHY